LISLLMNIATAPRHNRSAAPSPSCRVCRSSGVRPFAAVEGKHYWRCETCEATFLEEAQLPSIVEEFAHYLHHENDADDPRYRSFVSKLAQPLLDALPERQNGLDYGCGPSSALAAMLRQAGHAVRTYDPFFEPDQEALERRYDFIACSEVVEHFHNPGDEFDRLDAMLRPGGWLGIMTCFQAEDRRFDEWHYRRDPTHVAFYQEGTFRHLSRQRDWHCAIPAKDVVLIRKPRATEASAA
jgi:SAM-dependent methyltransferase